MHANAPLSPEGRLRLCLRIKDGWSVTAAVESMNVSRQTAHKWWRRFCDAGTCGLVDRSSRPRSCPHQKPAAVERRIVTLRRSRMLGPARLAGIVEVPASTIHRILVRHGVNRLKWMDRTNGRLVRRIETDRCGELVHIDVKKLGRAATQDCRGPSYTHFHTAIDAHSWLAYSEFAGTRSTVN